MTIYAERSQDLELSFSFRKGSNRTSSVNRLTYGHGGWSARYALYWSTLSGRTTFKVLSRHFPKEHKIFPNLGMFILRLESKPMLNGGQLYLLNNISRLIRKELK